MVPTCLVKNSVTGAGSGTTRSRRVNCFEDETVWTPPRPKSGFLGGAMSGALTIVSRYGTIVSPVWISQRANRSRRSFRHRSRCSSPAVRMTCSPLESTSYCAQGSLCSRRRRPVTTLFRSAGLTGSRDTRTIGGVAMDTPAKLTLPSSWLQSVPVLRTCPARPPIPKTTPAGTDWSGSRLRPMRRYRSVMITFCGSGLAWGSAGENLGPRTYIESPTESVPE